MITQDELKEEINVISDINKKIDILRWISRMIMDKSQADLKSKNNI
jgi:hypothetical protein